MGVDVLTDPTWPHEGDSPRSCHVPGMKLVCRYCHRECEPSPLEARRMCAPLHWRMCTRSEEDCDLVDERRTT